MYTSTIFGSVILSQCDVQMNKIYNIFIKHISFKVIVMYRAKSVDIKLLI